MNEKDQMVQAVEQTAALVFSSVNEGFDTEQVFEKVWITAAMRAGVKIDQFPVIRVIAAAVDTALTCLSNHVWAEDITYEELKEASWKALQTRACIDTARAVDDLKNLREEMEEALRELQNESIVDRCGESGSNERMAEFEGMLEKLLEGQRKESARDEWNRKHPHGPIAGPPWKSEGTWIGGIDSATTGEDKTIAQSMSKLSEDAKKLFNSKHAGLDPLKNIIPE